MYVIVYTNNSLIIVNVIKCIHDKCLLVFNYVNKNTWFHRVSVVNRATWLAHVPYFTTSLHPRHHHDDHHVLSTCKHFHVVVFLPFLSYLLCKQFHPFCTIHFTHTHVG